MLKHYILNLNPQATCEWDRCIIRNPITGERPNLTAEIAKAIGHQTGSYLVKVNMEIEVLETALPVLTTINSIQVKNKNMATKKLIAS